MLMVLGLLLTGVLPAQASAKPNPKTVNLTLSDMPAGFTQALDQLLDNSHAAKGTGKSVAELNREGRILTSYREFDHSVIVGLVEVTGEVCTYTSVHNARSDYFRAIKSRLIGLPKGDTLQQMSAPKIGAATDAAVISFSANSTKAQGAIILFYEGSFAVTVAAIGVAETFDPGVVVGWAEHVEKRILHVK
jgi:hypothetical protein